MTNLLESSGYFWLHGTRIPKGRSAPRSAVAGTLTIEQSGLARLELHGLLIGGASDLAGALEPTKQFGDLFIHGILKGTAARVLLGRIQRDGASASMVGGISFERFLARDCLVSQGHREAPINPDQFTSMEIELSNLDAWIGLRTISVKKSSDGYSATFEPQRPRIYKTALGVLTISHSVTPSPDQVFEGTFERVDIRQKTSACLAQTRRQPLHAHLEKFRLLEDFFLFLIGEDVLLDWPRLRVGSDQRVRYYFSRQKRTNARTGALRWVDCWTSLKLTEETLGLLLNRFVHVRDELGPGIYLYLGTRRAMLYPENRFANFIWGLESLHRRNADPGDTSAELSGDLKAKIDRILADVQLARDKKWLSNRLRGCTEPTLEQRLVEVFSTLPVALDKVSLREFCRKCANRRNDISHFGGQRHKDGDYTAFVAEIMFLANAIEVLYHAKVLQEIGLSDDTLKQWLLHGPNSYTYRKWLHGAGLKFVSPIQDKEAH